MIVGLLRVDGVLDRFGEGKEAVDGLAVFDELQRREAAAGEEAEDLRGGIAQLAQRLAGVEERLSRLGDCPGDGGRGAERIPARRRRL